MTGLLIKDWLLLKRQGRYLAVALVIVCAMAFVGSESYSSFITSYLTFMISMFAVSSFSYDEYDNGMPFLMALPSGREDYVKAKYTFSFLLIAGGWLAGTLLRMAFFLSRHHLEEYMEMLPSEPIYLFFCLIYIGLALPVLIRFGSEKGRNLVFTTLAVVTIGIFTVVKTGVGIPELKRFLMMAESSAGLALGCLAAAVLLIWGISYRVSLQIIRKKEF